MSKVLRDIVDFLLILFLAYGISIFIRAHGYTNFDGRWEGIWYEPGATVNITLYTEQCLPEQLEQVEWAIHHFTYMLNLADDNGRNFVYKGRELSGSGWGNWGQDYTPGEVNGSIECDSKLNSAYGLAVPIQLDQGKIVDFGIMLSSMGVMPPWRTNDVTTHELGHAILAQNHSTVSGSNMNVDSFQTEFSAQIKETWTLDFICGLKDKYEEIGEKINPAIWYVPQVDDLAHVRYNHLRYNHNDYQAFMLADGESSWSIFPGSVKEIPNCSELKE